MKFCENNKLGLLYKILSRKDIHGNSGLSYLESKDIVYTKEPGEADFFVSISGRCLPKFALNRTVLVISEPRSRYAKEYEKKFRDIFNGFMGICQDQAFSEDEFYLIPQDYSGIQEIQDEPEYWLAMVHQRYNKKYRNLPGDIERENACAFFDRAFGDTFHTYGRVWKKTLPWDNIGWKGTIGGSIMGDEKLRILRNYKFLLCFENSREPGYVTEKIFSAFFAGSVPIYFGAPDVAEYIPSDCYIEFEGQDYPALYDRITSMGEEEFQSMRRCAREFLESSDGEKFTSIAFAKTLRKHFLKFESIPKNPYSLDNLWRKLNFQYRRYKLRD